MRKDALGRECPDGVAEEALRKMPESKFMHLDKVQDMDGLWRWAAIVTFVEYGQQRVAVFDAFTGDYLGDR